MNIEALIDEWLRAPDFCHGEFWDGESFDDRMITMIDELRDYQWKLDDAGIDFDISEILGFPKSEIEEKVNMLISEKKREIKDVMNSG